MPLYFHVAQTNRHHMSSCIPIGAAVHPEKGGRWTPVRAEASHVVHIVPVDELARSALCRPRDQVGGVTR